MDGAINGVVNGLVAMKPFWLLTAWLASSVFAAFVALEKNRCGLCWFLMGVLFGPLALLATVGLPVKPPTPPDEKLKPNMPDAAHVPQGLHATAHPTAAHATSHHPQPAHAPVKQGFLESAMERPAAGVAVAAVVVLLLLIYFASRHL